MATYAGYESHPLADHFPLINDDELHQLADHIREHGLEEPVTLYEQQVLDGRNRLRACELAGIEPRFTEFTGDDPVAFVAGKNLLRRHLTASVRAAIAAELLPYYEALAKARMSDGGRSAAPGRPAKKGQAKIPDLSESRQARDDAAQAMQVSPRYVSDAKRIKEKDPQLFARVKSGAVPITKARRKRTTSTDTPEAIKAAHARVKEARKHGRMPDQRIEPLRSVVQALEPLFRNAEPGYYTDEIHKAAMILRRVLRKMETEGPPLEPDKDVRASPDSDAA